MSLRDQVIDLLQTRLLKDRAVTFDDTTSFIEAGVLDSMGMMELVSQLEGRFNIKVEDDELDPENLDSISALVGFLQRKGVPA